MADPPGLLLPAIHGTRRCSLRLSYGRLDIRVGNILGLSDETVGLDLGSLSYKYKLVDSPADMHMSFLRPDLMNQRMSKQPIRCCTSSRTFGPAEEKTASQLTVKSV